MIAPTAPTHTVGTGAGLVAFHDEGEGPPVLLLHGFPASSWQWRDFLPLLAARFRVIAPDLPGAGASRPADGVTLDLSTLAGAMRELVDSLGIERFAVVAHGVGAGVAQVLVIEQNHGAQLFRYLRSMYDLPGKPQSFHRPGPLPIRPEEVHRQITEWSRA